MDPSRQFAKLAADLSRNMPGVGLGGESQIDIGGNATAPVIAGHRNILVDAQHGSSVNLLMERELPQPVRRTRVELLPRRAAAPLGRDAELATLADAVRAGGPVQLWGPAGAGKSALLRYAAWSLEPGPDGVLFLSAAHREPGDLAQAVFEACYEATGYAPSNTVLRRLMGGVRVTVYVDDAEFTAEQLRELMDAIPNATFVFAAARRTLLGDGTALEVSGLDRAAALRLLTRELGHPTPGSESAAVELWKAAGGLPLLLLRAAALARPDSSGRPQLPRPGAVADLLPSLLDQLDAAERSVLRLLATLTDAELNPVHITALTEVPDSPVRCGRLEELGLVVGTEHGYRCVADVAPVLWRRGAEPFPADRLCEYLVKWAIMPSTAPAQVADQARAMEVAAVLAERAGRADLAVRVARAAAPAVARSLRFGVWGRLLDQGRAAARQTGDARALAYFTHEQGIRSLVTGRRVASAALLAEAVTLWRRAGDERGAEAALDAQQYAPQPGPSDPPPQPAPADGVSSAHDTAASVGDGFGRQDAGWLPGNGLTGQPSGTPGGNVTVNPGSSGPAATHAWQAGYGPSAPPPPSPVPPLPAGVGKASTVSSGTATGGAKAGAAAAGGAATAGGISGVTLLLTIVAVVVAVVVGPLTIIREITDLLGDAATGQPTSTGLAGNWWPEEGPAFTIRESGPGRYTYLVAPDCGETSTVELTQRGAVYRGTEPIYDQSSCQRVGYADVTITLAPDEQTAQITRELSANSGELFCSVGCGTFTLTRES